LKTNTERVIRVDYIVKFDYQINANIFWQYRKFQGLFQPLDFVFRSIELQMSEDGSAFVRRMQGNHRTNGKRKSEEKRQKAGRLFRFIGLFGTFLIEF